MNNYDIQFNEKFLPLFQENKNIRYICIYGGRGGGKSTAVPAWLLTKKIIVQNETIVFFRKTMVSTRDSIVSDFLKIAETLGLRGKLYSKLGIVTSLIKKKGTEASKIIFKGWLPPRAGDLQHLKGVSEQTVAVFEECEDLDEETYRAVNGSIRAKGRDLKLIFVFNPKHKRSFIYNHFFKKNNVESGFSGIKNDTLYIYVTYRDNISNLNESYIKDIEDLKKENYKKYCHEYLGHFKDAVIGVIFNYKRQDEFPNYLKVFFGQDYGQEIDPTTLVKVAVDHDLQIIYVEECFFEYRIFGNITDIQENRYGKLIGLTKKYVGDRCVICDYAGLGGVAIGVLRDNGINAFKADKNKVVDSIARTLKYTIVVCGESPNLTEELENYCWSKKDDKEPIDAYNHCIDAMFYASKEAIGETRKPVESFKVSTGKNTRRYV